MLISVVLVFFIYQLILISGVLVGLDEYADTSKEAALEKAYRESVIEGDIVDCNMANITEATELGEEAICYFPEAYGMLVGYNSLVYGEYGLRSTYEEYLFYETKDQKGATIQLTTDNNLQVFCYNLLEQAGSVTILNNQTGEVMAFASREDVEIDVNNINYDTLNEYNSYEGFWLVNGITEKSAPGSTFKMIIAASAFENELADFVVNDTGAYTTSTGEVINNYNSNAYGTIGITEAFRYSSNVYFSALGVELGGIELEDIASRFLIGETIELDFTTLESSFDLYNGSEFLIAQTAFGQGMTEITPFHLAMITQSIVSEGVMMQPYIIGEIFLEDKVLVEGEKEILATPISESVANRVKELMVYTAQNAYGIDVDGVGLKTGTAELGNGYNQVYVVGFTNEYSICITYNETEYTSAILVDEFVEIVDYLTKYL